MSTRRTLFIVLFSLAEAGTLCAQEPLTDVRLVATDTLRDVAITNLEGDRPVIYYNPALIERVGPLLRDFFIAHEYGHVFYAHTGGALAGRDSASAEVRQRQELQADCYAANRLARTSRTSVEAAIAFFTRMGLYSHDRFHPSGASRAANLLACLPPATSETLAAASRPASDVTTIELGPDAAGRLRGLVRVRIDGRIVGTISTLGPTTPLTIKRLQPGPHRYELTIELFSIDGLLQMNPSGVIQGNGIVEFAKAGHLEINWLDDEPPALLPAEGAPRRAIP